MSVVCLKFRNVGWSIWEFGCGRCRYGKYRLLNLIYGHFSFCDHFKSTYDQIYVNRLPKEMKSIRRRHLCHDFLLIAFHFNANIVTIIWINTNVAYIKSTLFFFILQSCDISWATRVKIVTPYADLFMESLHWNVKEQRLIFFFSA